MDGEVEADDIFMSLLLPGEAAGEAKGGTDEVLERTAEGLLEGNDDGLATGETKRNSVGLLLLGKGKGVAVGETDGMVDGEEGGLLEGDDDGCTEEEAEGSSCVGWQLLLLLGEAEGKVEGLLEGGATTVPTTAAKVVVAGVGVVGAVRVVMGWLVEGEAFLQTKAATTRRTVAKSVPANHACMRRVGWLRCAFGSASVLWMGLAAPVPAPVTVRPLPSFD